MNGEGKTREAHQKSERDAGIMFEDPIKNNNPNQIEESAA